MYLFKRINSEENHNRMHFDRKNNALEKLLKLFHIQSVLTCVVAVIVISRLLLLIFYHYVLRSHTYGKFAVNMQIAFSFDYLLRE